MKPINQNYSSAILTRGKCKHAPVKQDGIIEEMHWPCTVPCL